MGIEQKRRGQSPQFRAPDIPPEQWCDTRTQYESGVTLREIAAVRHCDPRTVKACIMRNDDQLDQKRTPKLIDDQIPAIHALLESGICKDAPSLRSLTRQLLSQLQAITHYKGSEKTLRNYLLTLPDEQLPCSCRQKNRPEEDIEC